MRRRVRRIATSTGRRNRASPTAPAIMDDPQGRGRPPSIGDRGLRRRRGQVLDSPTRPRPIEFEADRYAGHGTSCTALRSRPCWSWPRSVWPAPSPGRRPPTPSPKPVASSPRRRRRGRRDPRRRPARRRRRARTPSSNCSGGPTRSPRSRPQAAGRPRDAETYRENLKILSRKSRPARAARPARPRPPAVEPAESPLRSPDPPAGPTPSARRPAPSVDSRRTARSAPPPAAGRGPVASRSRRGRRRRAGGPAADAGRGPRPDLAAADAAFAAKDYAEAGRIYADPRQGETAARRASRPLDLLPGLRGRHADQRPPRDRRRVGEHQRRDRADPRPEPEQLAGRIPPQPRRRALAAGKKTKPAQGRRRPGLRPPRSRRPPAAGPARPGRRRPPSPAPPPSSSPRSAEPGRPGRPRRRPLAVPRLGQLPDLPRRPGPRAEGRPGRRGRPDASRPSGGPTRPRAAPGSRSARSTSTRPPRQYAQMTGQPEDSPGFSTMGMNAGRIISRRVNLRADHPTLVQAVLPHEITHVILADFFTEQQIPRWADEGMAVLSEPVDEQQRRAADLVDPLAANRLFPVDALMSMDYPDNRYWGLYYAQSVSLTRFLVEQGTPGQMIQFLQDSQREGYEAALRRVYKIDGLPRPPAALARLRPRPRADARTAAARGDRPRPQGPLSRLGRGLRGRRGSPGRSSRRRTDRSRSGPPPGPRRTHQACRTSPGPAPRPPGPRAAGGAARGARRRPGRPTMTRQTRRPVADRGSRPAPGTRWVRLGPAGRSTQGNARRTSAACAISRARFDRDPGREPVDGLARRGSAGETGSWSRAARPATASSRPGRATGGRPGSSGSGDRAGPRSTTGPRPGRGRPIAGGGRRARPAGFGPLEPLADRPGRLRAAGADGGPSGRSGARRSRRVRRRPGPGAAASLRAGRPSRRPVARSNRRSSRARAGEVGGLVGVGRRGEHQGVAGPGRRDVEEAEGLGVVGHPLAVAVDRPAQAAARLGFLAVLARRSSSTTGLTSGPSSGSKATRFSSPGRLRSRSGRTTIGNSSPLAWWIDIRRMISPSSSVVAAWVSLVAARRSARRRATKSARVNPPCSSNRRAIRTSFRAFARLRSPRNSPIRAAS